MTDPIKAQFHENSKFSNLLNHEFLTRLTHVTNNFEVIL